MRRSQRTAPRFPQSAVELMRFVCVYATVYFCLRLDLFVFVCVFGPAVFNSLQRASAHLPDHLPRFSLIALPGLCDNSERREACACERRIYVFDLRTVASICVCDRFLQTVCICICAKKLYYICVCFDRLSRLHSCTSRPPHNHPAPPPQNAHTYAHRQQRRVALRSDVVEPLEYLVLCHMWQCGWMYDMYSCRFYFESVFCSKQ